MKFVTALLGFFALESSLTFGREVNVEVNVVNGGTGSNDDQIDPVGNGIPEFCTLPLKPGDCFGDFPRYYYDERTKSCKYFSYGGCDGNANRFRTKEKCETAAVKCRPEHGKDPQFCTLPADPGPCKKHSLVPWYYYDKRTKSCKYLDYGGCGGNANRFRTKEECETAAVKCRPEPDGQPQFCTLPADPGPCMAAKPRYYNDYDKGCTVFHYGGCLGNENNFKTREECETACPMPGHDADEPIHCDMPKKVGPCKARFTRYYYNPWDGRCKRFDWGGCMPNANNFKTMEECEEASEDCGMLRDGK